MNQLYNNKSANFVNSFAGIDLNIYNRNVDRNLSQFNNLANEELFSDQPKKKTPLWLFLIILSVLVILIVFVSPFFKQNRVVLFSSLPDRQAGQPASEQEETIFSNSFADSNILILGVPGQGNDAPNLTDTILLAVIKNNSIILISIPRDLLIEIPPFVPLRGTTEDKSNGKYTKINALYSLGNSPDLIQKKVEEISGLSINHYIVVDLQVIKELIDKMGGVNILVQKDIYDINYPGPNHSFQTFEIKAGWRYFDGETALKYIRSRYSTSDFDRMERQQQVVEATKNKLSSLKIWNVKEIFGIGQSLSSRVKTDLNPWEIWQVWETVNNPPNGRTNNQIEKYAVDEKFLISDNVNLGGEPASVLKPRAGLENYSEIKEFIQNL